MYVEIIDDQNDLSSINYTPTAFVHMNRMNYEIVLVMVRDLRLLPHAFDGIRSRSNAYID